MSAKESRLKKEPSKDIANRLKNLREDKDLTLNEVAERLNPYVEINLEGNVGRSTISNLENQKQNLTIEIAIAYSKVFDVSLEYILCLSSDLQPKNRLIREELGLSDKSINIIKNLNDPDIDQFPQYKPPYDKILNTLFEEGFMPELLKAFGYFGAEVVARRKLAGWRKGLYEDVDDIILPRIYDINKEITDALSHVMCPLMRELYNHYHGQGDLP